MLRHKEIKLPTLLSPVTFGMLSGTADQWSTGPQQATIPAPYTDQVRSICLAAWKKLAEGPSEPPILGIIQKNNDDLSTFIDRVEKSIQRKFPLGPLRDQFVRLLVWEGMNSDHKLACAGQKFFQQWHIRHNARTPHFRFMLNSLFKYFFFPLISFCGLALFIGCHF